MQLFQILVLIVSISVFIGLFIYTAVVFYSGDKSIIYPPDITSCPDYWKLMKIDAEGDERIVCKIPLPHELNLGHLKEKGDNIYKYSKIDENDNNNYMSYLPGYSEETNTIKTGELENALKYYSIDDIPEGYGNAYNRNFGTKFEEFEKKNYIDFQHAGWASQGDPFCRINNWAKINNIQWDGMSNYNRCK